MSPNPERAALLSNVVRCPTDDLARLVLADWMEERGSKSDQIRARFIRRQFAGMCDCVPLTVLCDLEPVIGRQPHQYAFNSSSSPGQAEAGYDSGVTLLFEKGFVAEVHLPLAAFLAHARDLFAAHPVERVVISDAHIFPSGGNNTYYLGGLGRFPKEYWRRLDGLPSERAVREAVSAVCVHWGRTLAGLPVTDSQHIV